MADSGAGESRPRYRPKPPAAIGARARGSPEVWAIVLAGGEGVRLRSLVRHVCGDDRPKQYVPLMGPRTLLEQTLDRVALEIPPERTVVVTVRGHARYFGDGGAMRRAHVLVQPEGRGTAAGILYPALWVWRRDPAATVVVFPSDHFVLEERPFMRHAVAAAAEASRLPGRLVVLGARPADPEPEYGWIEPGERLPGSRRLLAVRRFLEKPSRSGAGALLAAGCLWNTFVVSARVDALLAAGRDRLPETMQRLEQAGRFAGAGDDEQWALHQAYALLRPESFSRAVLEASPSLLAVDPLPPLTWSDLGTPRRVLALVRQLDLPVPWAAVDLPA